MAKYIAKRVALALVTLVIVSMLTFFLMFLVPGGPFLSEKSPSPAVLAAMEEKYGLDKPVIVQYKNYMLNLLQGELGPSIKQRGRTVAQIIGSRFPVSARIGGIALAIAVVVGVVLGSVAALNRGKWIDNVIIVIATCGIAVPSFVVCTILLYIFSLKLGWLPSYGLTGWKNYIMPVIALGFYPTAYICRLMRSSMLDVLGQDYMRTARAKGLSQGKSLFKHALRNYDPGPGRQLRQLYHRPRLYGYHGNHDLPGHAHHHDERDRGHRVQDHRSADQAEISGRRAKEWKTKNRS